MHLIYIGSRGFEIESLPLPDEISSAEPDTIHVIMAPHLPVDASRCNICRSLPHQEYHKPAMREPEIPWCDVCEQYVLDGYCGCDE